MKVHALGHSNAVIHVYAGDHAPPHFHVFGRGWSASVELRTLQVTAMRGDVPSSALSDAIAWASDNLALLYAKWDEFNERDN